MSSYLKYQKYKIKYVRLKKQLDGNNYQKYYQIIIIYLKMILKAVF